MLKQVSERKPSYNQTQHQKILIKLRTKRKQQQKSSLPS